MKKEDNDKTRLRDISNVKGVVEKPTDDMTIINQVNLRNACSDDADNNETIIRNLKQNTNKQDGSLSPIQNNSDQYAFNNLLTNKILKNRFVLEDILGTGGMGIVYKAKDLLKVEANDRNPYLAIKVLSDEFKTHPEAFVSLQRESRKSQGIAHPNIVNVYDFDRDGDIVFMTMEYMSGKSLDNLIRQYKTTGLPTEDGWGIIKGICQALIYAHAENIVHSDFKPGNVFVCDNGITKVFDFGIARAVSEAETFDNDFLDKARSQSKGISNDKTIFDAGNLGALTPPYASLEMLQGEKPDIRDDIYALGCVAYEMFAGVHPFNKLPANEAQKKNLKPRRIPQLGNRQWKAIEKALAFKREDRLESVKQFLTECESVYKFPIMLPLVGSVILILTSVIYFQYTNSSSIPSEFSIRNELEYKIRMELHIKNLERLLKNPLFTVAWEEQVWSEIRNTKLISKKEDQWIKNTEESIYQLYLQQIKKSLTAKRYQATRLLIDNALRYTDNTTRLDELGKLLEQSILDSKEKRKLAALPIKNKKPVKKVKNKTQLFDYALVNVNQQLECSSRLNMRELNTAISKLKSLNLKRYKKLESALVQSLADCITVVGKSSPKRAMDAKKYALRIFNGNHIISSIIINPLDACDKSIAGLGARGKRAICKDAIDEKLNGPFLVVVPGTANTKAFAIGKYEISIGELNIFCKLASACEENTNQDPDLPVSNISFNTAQAYARWLSKKTGKKYRIPTKVEWTYAAKSKSLTLDPNRNCELSTRGIQKGLELSKASIGKQNAWGLVNSVGNIQEWVYGSGKVIMAAGGSYESPMEHCNTNTYLAHSGRAAPNTGFRLLREVN